MTGYSGPHPWGRYRKLAAVVLALCIGFALAAWVLGAGYNLILVPLLVAGGFGSILSLVAALKAPERAAASVNAKPKPESTDGRQGCRLPVMVRGRHG